MTLYARRKDDRIICGVRGCAKDLGVIYSERPDWQLAAFPMGWTPDEQGVWRLTRRATRIAKSGLGTVERHEVTGRAHDPALPGGAGLAPWGLPVDCVCPMPKCGARQTLDADRLGVMPNPNRPRATAMPDGTTKRVPSNMAGLLVNISRSARDTMR